MRAAMRAYSVLVLVTVFSSGCLAHSIQSILACSFLVNSLGSSIVQSPSGPEFNAGARNAWNLFNDVLTPACIVFPRRASHVQQAMKTIFEFGVRYAVQAGSHSAMVGWNNVQDGVLIHFLNMTNVSFDPVSDTITLEPGVHWEDAVAALESQGVAPVGGRQGDAGTGLLLGGGLSFLSPSHGYCADNFKSVDVVLVTGELVIATANNQHADLFRALKGSGNRFGIVTKYELIPAHTGTKEDKVFFGGSITYPPSSVPAVVNATAHYVRDATDPKATLLVNVIGVNSPVGVQTLSVIFLFYNGTSLPDSIFGELLAIPAISKTLGPLSYFDVAAAVTIGDQRGFGQEFGASALLGDETLFTNAVTHWTNFTKTFMSEMSLSLLTFTPVTTTQIEIGRQRGGNAINPPLVNFAYLLLGQQYLPNVTTISTDVEAGKLFLFDQIPRSPGLPFFMNECDKRQNVFETYSTFNELKEVYFKYDPTAFNIRHTDGPIGLVPEEEGFFPFII